MGIVAAGSMCRNAESDGFLPNRLVPRKCPTAASCLRLPRSGIIFAAFVISVCIERQNKE
jgi:hypothetical protein